MSKSQVDTEEIRLRRWIAKREGVPDVSEPIWQLIVDDRYLGDWRAADDAEARDRARQEIWDRYRRLKRLVRDAGGEVVAASQDGQERESTSLTPNLPTGDPILSRAASLCLYWAKLAEAEEGVRRFRKDVLGGAAVSKSVAREFILSPATALLSLETFKRRKIPVVGHTAELLSYEKANPYERPYWARASVKITWAGGQTVIEPRMEEPAPMEALTFWDGEMQVLAAPWRFSILRRLHELASDLCNRYPWEPQDAAWLILTGEGPWTPPLTARIKGPHIPRNHGTITITAAHWVPKDAVARFYGDLKSRIDSAPTPSLRRLALFRFVVERSQGKDQWESEKPGEPKSVHVQGLHIPPWRSLQAQWNAEYPDWHYSDPRNLRRDFKKAFEALAGYW